MEGWVPGDGRPLNVALEKENQLGAGGVFMSL
jgi:hypothetical protein